MIRSALLGPFWVLALAAPAQAEPDSVFGRWIPPDRDAVIEIRDTEAGAEVRLAALLAGPNPDAENPDRALRDRPLEGLVLGAGFRRDGSWWSGGELYDPASGRSYRARFRLDGPEHLEVHGYVGTPLLGRSQRWLRESAFAERMLRMLDPRRCEGER